LPAGLHTADECWLDDLFRWRHHVSELRREFTDEFEHRGESCSELDWTNLCEQLNGCFLIVSTEFDWSERC
jgi:hypothetical protein